MFKNRFNLIISIIFFIFIFVNISNADDDIWIDFNNGFSGGNVQTVKIDPDDLTMLYIGTLGAGFYYSTDAGESWTQHNDNLNCWNILSLLVKKKDETKVIYAGTTQGVFYLENLNGPWQFFHEALTNCYINMLRDCKSPSRNAIYAGSGEYNQNIASRGLWVLEKDKTPVPVIFGPYNPNVFDLIPYRDVGRAQDIKKFYAATDTGLFKFRNINEVGEHRLEDSKVFALAARPKDATKFTIYAGTLEGGKSSKNEGNNWWPYDSFLENEKITALVPSICDTSLGCYAVTYPSGVCRKLNTEAKWDTANNIGLPNQKINTLAVSEKQLHHIFAAMDLGLYCSFNYGNNWVPKNNGFSVYKVYDLVHDAHNKNRLIAATDRTIWYKEFEDTGIEWYPEQDLDAPITTIALDSKNNSLYAGTKGKYIYRKNIEENTWIQIANDLPDSNITVINIDSTTHGKLYIGTEHNGIFEVVDDNWEQMEIYSSELNDAFITDIVIDNSQQKILYVSTLEKGVYKIDSAGYDQFWDRGEIDVYSIVYDKLSDLIFAATSKGVYVCDNIEAFTWMQYNQLWGVNVKQLQLIPTVSPYQNVLYAMIFDSTDKQTKYTQVYRNLINSETLINYTAKSLFPDRQLGKSFYVNLNHPNTVYLGTGGTGIYQYNFETKMPQLDTSSINFGVVLKDSTKFDTITIKNTMDFSPLITSFELTGSEDFEINLSQANIYPGSSRICTLKFTPKSLGEQNAVLKIKCVDIFANHEVDTSFQINLSGSAQLTYGEFRINNSVNDTISYHFYNTHTNDRTEVIIGWENYGNAALRNFNITGPTETDFFSTGEWPNACETGATGEIELIFHPALIHTIYDQITIEYDYVSGENIMKGNTKVIQLEGEGKDAILTLDTASFDFGAIPVHSQSLEKSFHLDNIGNIPLFIDSVYFSKNDSPFKIDTLYGLPDTISAGSNGNYLQIYFSPTETIAYEDTLNITHHDKYLDTGETSIIVLKGTGLEYMLESIPPHLVEFDSVHIKTTPRELFLTLIDSSENYTFWIDSLVTESDVFSIQKTPIVLQPGSEEKLRITFGANSANIGNYDDLLNIYYRYGINNTPTNSAKKNITLTGTIISGIPKLDIALWHSDKQLHVNDCIVDSIALQNLGNIPLHYDISASDFTEPFFLISDDSAGIILDSTSTAIKFKFCPQHINLQKTSIAIKFWDLDDTIKSTSRVDTTITLSLLGQGVDAIATWENVYPYRHTRANTMDTFFVNLKNTGNISMLDVECFSKPPFQVISNSATISPAENVDIPVEYSPTFPIGADSSKLYLGYTDSFLQQKNPPVIKNDSSFIVAGLSCASQLVFYDSLHNKKINTLNFGNVRWGDFSEQEIWLKNAGNLSLFLDSLYIPLPVYTIKSGEEVQFPLTIAPNDSKKFIVNFKPNSANNHDSFATFFYRDTLNNSQYYDTATLELNGVSDGALIIDSYSNSINFGDVQVYTDSSLLDTLFNPGNMPCKIESLSVNSDNFKYLFLFPEDSALAPNSSGLIQIIFSPTLLADYKDTCTIKYIEIGVNGGTLRTSEIELLGKGIDIISPIIDVINHTSPVLGDSISIEAHIYDEHSGLVNDSTQLWIRNGGEIKFSPLNFSRNDSTNSLFNFEIPGNLVTSQGIEYYIETYDKAGNLKHFPTGTEFGYVSLPIRIPDQGIVKQDRNGNTVYFHTGNAQQDYRLISIPLNIDTVYRSAKDVLESCLGLEVDPLVWRCAAYLHLQEEFVYLDQDRSFDFVPANSYFLLIGDTLFAAKYLQSQAGYTIRTDELYRIELQKGWNFIANPFNFPIPLNNLKLSSGKLGESPTLRTYYGAWGYEQEYIYPWEGYILHNMNDVIDTLLIMPDMSKPFQIYSQEDSTKQPQYQWFITIESSCKKAYDKNNIAAISKRSTHGLDKLDQPEPPPVGEYVMLAFPHQEWEKGCNFFTVDVQPPDTDGNFWDFSVYTNIKNSDVKLTFNNLHSIPEEFQIVLINESLNYKQNLRESNHFVYNSKTTQSGQKFRLLVGTTEFVDNNAFISLAPEVFHITSNFPNPFNSATNIRYDLPDNDFVNITVYNILGELVKILKNEEKQTAGKYIVNWDGTNRNGQQVGSGIYFCKFSSTKYAKILKMIMIR